MEKQFEEKTINALIWIIDLMNKNKIDYQITGGFAGKIFGSKRKLNDIDIDISEENFKYLIPEISEYIIYGPAHHKDVKWDLELITLNYGGQEIDIAGIDKALISNKKRNEWRSLPSNFSRSIEIMLRRKPIRIMNPGDFIKYKSNLDGEHQKEDIKAAQDYLLKLNTF